MIVGKYGDCVHATRIRGRGDGVRPCRYRPGSAAWAPAATALVLLAAGVAAGGARAESGSVSLDPTIAKGGRPVCINIHLRRTDLRKGSISI